MVVLCLALLGLGCKDLLQAPSGLNYSVNPASYTTNVAIAPNTPSQSGGKVESYAVTPALPAGLSLDVQSGVISGTPTAATALASYTVTATNTAGSATVSLSITVSDPPAPLAITTQPVSQSVLVGQTATFSVTATGTGTLTYQWLKGGAAITGATASTYTTPATVQGDDGSLFSVQIADGIGGSLTSATATLSVLPAGGPGTSLATDAMTGARGFHTSTLLASGKVLVAGGYDGSLALSSAEIYDPAAGVFGASASMVSPRQAHTATRLADGKVLLVGGTSLGVMLDGAELYDPATGKFTATGKLTTARSDHSATLLSNGKVLIVGGRNLGSYLATAELYDPATGAFTATVGAPLAARATHTATLLANGKVLIAGGFRSAALATAELYDPATDAFTATGSLGTARAYQTATLLGTGKVLIVGGATTAVAELYDPAAGTFSATGNLVTIRAFWHTAALLPTGKVLVSGGRGSGSPAPILAAEELYDPATGVFTATGAMTTTRETHAATPLSNGKVLITGGVGFGYLPTAELYY
jgi:hypothetical protein